MHLNDVPGLSIYTRSIVETDEATYFLARGSEGKRLGILPVTSERRDGLEAAFEGDWQSGPGVLLCPLTPQNAAALRERLAWLRPEPLGLATSAGCGDRLGLATPGHIRALRSAGGVAPILAQQSMRENARTGRSPQQVMDDAMWGVFQEGWRQPWGADADHLKTKADVDLCVAAGYSFYTVDPGDHVDNAAHTEPLETLRPKITALPWDALEDSPEGLHLRYLHRPFEIEGRRLAFDELALARAAAKYGKAVAHTACMYRHLAAAVGSQPFELEVSVDETETPTSPLEHLFVASELRRLGVKWISLAPRYVGRFEKGVDYIGDLAEFDAEFAVHAAIAREMGPYKLSLHSGSDKFSIYPLVARQARGQVHLKTAGTSYLEALRAVAGVDPSLFRQVLAFALERYAEDQATYHVSADPARVPGPAGLRDGELAGVLDLFDGRQVLHVTFGSVLARFGQRLLATLDAHEEAHYAALEQHFGRHVAPFVEQ